MTRPEEALALARARAAAARERGAYADDIADDAMEPADTVALDRLLEAAIIDPDLEHVRSTRRFGAPITFGKRMLMRSLRQYNDQVLGQQQAFNIQLALYVGQLADRVERLEAPRD